MTIRENLQELAERMGSMASTDEAERMADLLKSRGITEFEQLSEMSDREFFALIPLSVNRA